MAVLCREFDISRKTGYNIFERYKNCGIDGLNDQPHRQNVGIKEIAAKIWPVSFTHYDLGFFDHETARV